MSDNATPATAPFDMPDTTQSFAKRGGWVVNRLAADVHLSPNQSAGIVGNCGYESEGFRALQEIRPIKGRGGYGWPMWTGARRSAFEAWCAAQDLDPASDRANYGYLVEELLSTDVGARTLAALRAESTLERCVFVVGRLYETPAGTTDTHLPGYADRLTWAQRALAGAMGLAEPKPSTDPAVIDHHAATASLGASAPSSRNATSSASPPIGTKALPHPVHIAGAGMGIGLALTETSVWALSLVHIPVPQSVADGWVLLFGVMGAIALHYRPWLATVVPKGDGG